MTEDRTSIETTLDELLRAAVSVDPGRARDIAAASLEASDRTPRRWPVAVAVLVVAGVAWLAGGRPRHEPPAATSTPVTVRATYTVIAINATPDRPSAQTVVISRGPSS